MNFTRIALVLAFGVAVVPACASGGTGDSDMGGGGAGGGGGGASCGATVLCGGGETYQSCMNAAGDCYLQISTGQQVPCTTCDSCPTTGTCGSGGAGGSGGTGGIGGAGGTGGTGGTGGSGGSAGSGGSGGTGGTGGSGGAAGAGGSGGAGGTGGTGGSGGSGGSGEDAGGGDSATDPDPTCATMSATACVDCCQTAYAEGAQTFVNALGECACGSVCPSCETNWCEGSTASTACQKCLDDSLGTSGACLTPVLDTCEEDSDCVNYVNCGDFCPSS